MLEAGWNLYTAVGTQRVPSGKERLTHIVFGEFIRACRLFRCALALVADGFGPEAEALTRGMYESSLVANWVMENPVQAVDRFDLHLAYSLTFLNIEPDDALEPPPEMSAEEVTRAVSFFGRYGERPWHGKRLVELDRRLTQKLRSSSGDYPLTGYLDGIHRWLNWNVHGSPINLLRPTDVRGAERLFIVAPAERDLGDAMRNAINQMTLALAVRFAFTGEDPNATLKKAIFEAWRSLNPSAYATGRNDPCPCGSGRKYKECHLL